MNKLWLIVRREYSIRVRHKYFLLTTFLAPLGIVLLTVLPILVMDSMNDGRRKVWVVDPNQQVLPHLASDNDLEFVAYTGPESDIDSLLLQNEDDLALFVPTDLGKANLNLGLRGKQSPGLSTEQRIRRSLKDAIRQLRLKNSGLDEEKLKLLDFELALVFSSAGDNQQTSTLFASVLGFIMGFLVYIMIAIYGSMVMRSVLEEKTNRIVEVLLSAVRPMQLLFGKVVAIALVGVTQLLLWAVLMLTLLFVLAPLLAGVASPESGVLPAGAPSGTNMLQLQSELARIQNSLDWSMLLVFPLYFLGGFLIYGSLYAALAASASQESDVQSLSFIVFIPVIIPMVLLSGIVEHPQSSLGVFMSLFPLFSPIIHPARLAAMDVPLWQGAASFVLLVAGIWFFMWVAARVYRAGLLFYGQKPSLGRLARWALGRS